MSWHFSFYAKTKEVAIARIDKERSQNDHFPQGVADAVKGLVNFLPESKRLISVMSSGSSYDGGGNAAVTVQLVDLLE